MYKDNNKRVDELIELVKLNTYDLVTEPGFSDAKSTLEDNSKVLDSILAELLIEERNFKIDTLTQETHEQVKKGNTRRNR